MILPATADVPSQSLIKLDVPITPKWNYPPEKASVVALSTLEISLHNEVAKEHNPTSALTTDFGYRRDNV